MEELRNRITMAHKVRQAGFSSQEAYIDTMGSLLDRLINMPNVSFEDKLQYLKDLEKSGAIDTSLGQRAGERLFTALTHMPAPASAPVMPPVSRVSEVDLVASVMRFEVSVKAVVHRGR